MPWSTPLAELVLAGVAASRGDAGRALVEAATGWMTGQRIKHPARWAAMLAPGFPD